MFKISQSPVCKFYHKINPKNVLAESLEYKKSGKIFEVDKDGHVFLKKEIEIWCHENLTSGWRTLGSVIGFMNEQDMILFKLRWF